MEFRKAARLLRLLALFACVHSQESEDAFVCFCSIYSVDATFLRTPRFVRLDTWIHNLSPDKQHLKWKF